MRRINRLAVVGAMLTCVVATPVAAADQSFRGFADRVMGKYGGEFSDMSIYASEAQYELLGWVVDGATAMFEALL